MSHFCWVSRFIYSILTPNVTAEKDKIALIFFRYVAVRTVIILLLSSICALLLIPKLTPEFNGRYDGDDPTLLVIGTILMAPLIETLALAAMLVFTQKVIIFFGGEATQDWVIALFLGVLFGCAHSLLFFYWGLIVFGMGVVLAKAIVDWQKIHSLKMGIFASFLIHSVCNAIARSALLWLKIA
jgi:hypothetical protein